MQIQWELQKWIIKNEVKRKWNQSKENDIKDNETKDNETKDNEAKDDKIKSLYRSADLRLNKILKLFSSSSNLSDFEILALISSIDVKLKLSLIEDWVHLLKSLETLINEIENRKDNSSTCSALIEVLKQYNYYFKSKLLIEGESIDKNQNTPRYI